MPPSSGFQSYTGPPGSTRSSTGLADLSWNSTLFDNLGGPAGAQAGAQAASKGRALMCVEGCAQGGQGGKPFGGVMTLLTSASQVLSCHVQPSGDCTVFKPLTEQQQ